MIAGQRTRTLADLRLYTRYIINELTAGAVIDASITQLDLDSMLFYGYEKVARDTKCFPVSYTLAATPDQSVYPYSSFGTLNAGARMFEISKVWYNQQPLTSATPESMDAMDPQWPFHSSGTPLCWITDGDGQLELYFGPSDAGSIFVRAWQTPDPTTFANDTDEPAIHPSDRYLIGLAAALYNTVGLLNTENSARTQIFEAKYQAGIMAMNKRIKGNRPVVFGRGSQNLGPLANINRTITGL